MSDFIKWTLEAIREEGSLMSWMEERRTEWTPLLASKLKFLLEGRAFILITDSERGWFEEYFLKNINFIRLLKISAQKRKSRCF